MHLDSRYTLVSRYIVKSMHLEKPKRLIIWNGWSRIQQYWTTVTAIQKVIAKEVQKDTCLNNYDTNSFGKHKYIATKRRNSLQDSQKTPFNSYTCEHPSFQAIKKAVTKAVTHTTVSIKINSLCTVYWKEICSSHNSIEKRKN